MNIMLFYNMSKPQPIKEMKPVLFEKITYAVAEIAKMLGISKGAA